MYFLWLIQLLLSNQIKHYYLSSIWNGLPLEIRNDSLFASFKKHLKTYYFSPFILLDLLNPPHHLPPGECPCLRFSLDWLRTLLFLLYRIVFSAPSAKWKFATTATIPQHTTIKRWTTHPEPVVGARVCEVDDQLERFVVERLECQKNVVDQQIAVHIQHPNSPTTSTLCSTFTLS